MKTTGRKFKCIGLKEIEGRMFNWSHSFTIGKIYDEVFEDCTGENLCNEMDLLLMDDEDYQRDWDLGGTYVDASQFELIEQ